MYESIGNWFRTRLDFRTSISDRIIHATSFAYCRVSTADQTTLNQSQAPNHYAAKGVGGIKYIGLEGASQRQMHVLPVEPHQRNDNRNDSRKQGCHPYRRAMPNRNAREFLRGQCRPKHGAHQRQCYCVEGCANKARDGTKQSALKQKP